MGLKLPEAMGQVYEVLEPFSPAERQRILLGVVAALGDWESVSLPFSPRSPGRACAEAPTEAGPLPQGPDEAQFRKHFHRWLSQHRVPIERVHDLFHVDSEGCKFIGTEIPGASTKHKVVNAYLLAGLCAFIATDETRFEDMDAVALCKHYKCHDSSNHSTYRKRGGNFFTGDKRGGFTLTAPGQKAAADLLRNWEC